MRTMTCILICLACLGLAAPLSAADYETGIQAFSHKDYRVAVANILPLAAQGEAKAQFAAGVLYQKGAGVLQDNALAWYWFTKALENGHDKAGQMRELLEGSMTDEEKEQAARYLEE